MSTRMHELVDGWKLLKSIERLKYHRLDNNIKDRSGNLPIHKLLGHADANDDSLKEGSTSRKDRTHFFNLLDVILDTYDEIPNETFIDIRNVEGKLPSELLNERVSAATSEEVQLLKRLKSFESFSLRLHSRVATKAPSAIEQQMEGYDTNTLQQEASEATLDFRQQQIKRKEHLKNTSSVLKQVENDVKALIAVLKHSEEKEEDLQKIIEAAKVDLEGKLQAERHQKLELQKELDIVKAKKLNLEEELKVAKEAIRKAEADCTASNETFKQKENHLEKQLQAAQADNEKKINMLQQELRRTEEADKTSKKALQQSKEKEKELQKTIEAAKADIENEIAKRKRAVGDIQKQWQDFHEQHKSSHKTQLDTAKLNAEKKIGELEAEKDRAKKENVECKAEIEKSKQELASSKQALGTIQEEHRERIDALLAQLDSFVNEVTDMYNGSPDEKYHSLKPSELSEVIRDGLIDNELRERAQFTLLEKILNRVKETSLTDRKKEFLRTDLPRLVTTLCFTTDRNQLFDVAQCLMSYLDSINFTDTRGNVRRAQALLTRFRTTSSSHSSSAGDSELSELKKICSELAGDCKLTDTVTDSLEGTSIDIPTKGEFESVNSHSYRTAVLSSSVNSGCQKRGRDTSSLDASPSASPGPANKKQK